jgi:CheY-like chemotaxis protein
MGNALELVPQPPTVLVVDDFAAVRRMLAEQLEGCGYRAVEAEDGDDALDHMRREHVDLVLTDLAMPGIHGHDLVRAMRELSPQMPVVVMTGAAALAATNADEAQPIEDYVDAVCLKPFRTADVIETVRELVRAA